MYCWQIISLIYSLSYFLVPFHLFWTNQSFYYRHIYVTSWCSYTMRQPRWAALSSSIHFSHVQPTHCSLTVSLSFIQCLCCHWHKHIRAFFIVIMTCPLEKQTGYLQSFNQHITLVSMCPHMLSSCRNRDTLIGLTALPAWSGILFLREVCRRSHVQPKCSQTEAVPSVSQ